MYRTILIAITCVFLFQSCSSRHENTFQYDVNITVVADGWAANSINAVIFRHNSITNDGRAEYTAFYTEDSSVAIAKRELNQEKWEIKKTQYKGDITDAHKCISIIVDGEGYLHMAWNHHGDTLNYCRSVEPGSLDMTNKLKMTGELEGNVTYPEFYKLNNGDLLFLYRDGSSGNGNLVMNYYDTKKQLWTKLHDNLISGEGKRNAYWQAAVGSDGTIQISWVWRESWDVSTNHDVCYAKSLDNGKTWQKSTGEKYKLPITLETAEYAAIIPQGSELINQTSMCADGEGHPYIATYMTAKGDSIPQYYVIYNKGQGWFTGQVTHRTKAFSLSGGGTKRIPISRPQIFVDSLNYVYMVYRDEELGSKALMSYSDDITEGSWKSISLTSSSVGMWEPTYDIDLWKKKNVLHLFLQNVSQGDGETLDGTTSTIISVLEWNRVIK